MLELARDLLPLLRSGERVAVATVTGVARSAPRGVGAALAVTRDARVIGSISGGCVEADAVALCLASLAQGRGAAARFGFSDEQAFEAGLACGGTVDAVVTVLTPADSVAIAALEDVEAGRAARLGLVVRGHGAGGVIAPDEVDATASAIVIEHRPAPRLIIAGAGEHAAALCRVAAAAGFAVTVCDAWETLATRERFPAAERVEAVPPHELLAALDPQGLDERTAICVLTHDERLDVPALVAALELPVGFVGAMGARSTVAHRAARLREAGVSEEALARLHSPLGLDLGGASPEETALSVLAEIVAARHGGSGRPLREGSGPLHARSGMRGTAAASVAACALEKAPA